ncbi:hypothetical protein Dimus_037335 [Dionaea muscipula]
MVLGPSILGRTKPLASHIFPLRGTMILETLSTFGLMLFLFAVGVRMDASMMMRAGRVSLKIGSSSLVFSLCIPIAVSHILQENVPLDPKLRILLPLIAGSQSITAFPVVACLLSELRMANTDVGHLAAASSMFCNLFSILLAATVFAIVETQKHGFLPSFGAISSTIALVLIIVFVIRPTILRIVHSDSVETAVKDFHIFVVLVSVLVSGFVSEVVGQHYFLGPIVLGLALPDTSPIGATVVSVLDTFVSGFLYPTFLTISGLKTNIFTIQFEALWVIGVIVLCAFLVKAAAVMVPAIHGGTPVQEAFVLGLVMNAKGINELVLYNLWKADGTLSDQEFSILVISVVVITATITPLIKILYNPARQYRPINRMTIQHSKGDIELRIVVCMHDQDNVPMVINILQASNATRVRPLAIIVVILEVVGRSSPMLVSYRPPKNLSQGCSKSNHIYNAFKHYQNYNKGAVSVQLFTNMSSYKNMPHDICRIAADKRANLLILPFHKQWAIDGTIERKSRTIQVMNAKLLEKAPCSIGILIDRGPTRGSKCIINKPVAFKVAVIFISGADDVESLAYGARMAGNQNVTLTVVRFLLLGDGFSRERRHDNDLIDQYVRRNDRSTPILYREEYVRDGVGMASVIRCMEGCFDLILVGRNHPPSQLINGLDMWSECQELGVIGDMLAAPNTASTTSVLVVQQQRLSRNVVKPFGYSKGYKDKYHPIYDVPDDDGETGSFHHVPFPIGYV